MTRPLPLLLVLSACTAPPSDEMFNQLSMSLLTGGEAANQAFVDLAGRAERTLDVALPGLTDDALADALIDASDAGVDVRVTVDVDNADDAGVALLRDVGIPVTLADGALSYFEFSLNEDVSWESDEVHMSHSFAVADRTKLVMASGAGDVLGGPRILWEGRSENLGDDLATEFQQVFGGSDATAVTAFDAMAKSVADVRWAYPTTDDEIVEVWFNPQERLVKRLIDGVYRARSSIRVMTDDLADEGLARALQRKAEDGFDVEVVVGARFGDSAPALSDILRNQTPGVTKLQVTTDDPLPTLVFVDFDPALDGWFHMPKAMVLTHPIYSAARLFNGEEVVNDQLVDGALYVLGAHGQPTAPLQELARLYTDVRADAEEL